MTAASARTMKEARAILYPWIGVILLCAIPLISRPFVLRTAFVIPGPNPFTTVLFQIGIFLGIPLLASLPFGNEFRYKTLDLLVSQPVNRLKIWREKWTVTTVAILTTALITALSSRSEYSDFGFATADFFLFLIVVACSAPFWTLVGKSTLGGFVLNIATCILFGSMKVGLLVWAADSRSIVSSIASAALVPAALAYSGFMLWLGRWMLVHRQSSGGNSGADVMDAIPRLVPASIASLLRCRPNQMVLNLFRKEVRLLRPLWMFTAVYVVGWCTMAISASFVPAEDAKQRALELSFIGLQSTYTILAILLAASLAFGEERHFGVQLWHLALPLSIRAQWLIRIVSSMFATVLSAIAIPLALLVLTRGVLHLEFMEKLELRSLLEFSPVLIIVFLFAFWCAVVARDLIRTAGLIAAAGGLIFVAGAVSRWITEQLIPLSIQLRWFVISQFQLNPDALQKPLGWLPDISRYFLWILAAFCVAIIVHTYPLFRRLPQESAAKLLRPLVPYLAVVALLVSLTTFQNWQYLWGAIGELFSDTEAAMVELPPDVPYTLEDLAKVSTIPGPTQRWLRNSTMTLAVSDFQPTGMQKTFFGEWNRQGTMTIRFQSGMTCKATFVFSNDKTPKVWGGAGKCE